MSSIKLEIVAFPGLGGRLAQLAHARYHVGDPQGTFVFPVPRGQHVAEAHRRSANDLAENIREAREFPAASPPRRAQANGAAQRHPADVLETREHLSIDELHRLVKRRTRIGFTTVYRP